MACRRRHSNCGRRLWARGDCSSVPCRLAACLSDFTTSSSTLTTCRRWLGSGRKRLAGGPSPCAIGRSSSGLTRTHPSACHPGRLRERLRRPAPDPRNRVIRPHVMHRAPTRSLGVGVPAVGGPGGRGAGGGVARLTVAAEVGRRPRTPSIRATGQAPHRPPPVRPLADCRNCVSRRSW